MRIFVCISVGNQVLTQGNTLLSLDEINKAVIMRMNFEFMQYMREHHPEASQQHFNMTVLKPEDNASDSEEEDPEEEKSEEELEHEGEREVVAEPVGV